MPRTIIKEDFMASKDIADRLGVLSSTYKPNARAINIVMKELGITHEFLDCGQRYYRTDILPRIRKWFYEAEMPDVVLDDQEKLIRIQYR